MPPLQYFYMGFVQLVPWNFLTRGHSELLERAAQNPCFSKILMKRFAVAQIPS